MEKEIRIILACLQIAVDNQDYVEFNCDNAKILLDEVSRLQSLTQWIDVKDRLPEIETTDVDSQYIVTVEPFAGKRFTTSMSFIKGDWWTGQYGCSTKWTIHVIAWQKLPLPLQEGVK